MLYPANVISNTLKTRSVAIAEIDDRTASSVITVQHAHHDYSRGGNFWGGVGSLRAQGR